MVLGEQTRPVQVQVRIQVLSAEIIDWCGKALRDMAVAEDLAYDRSILALGQGIIARAPGPRIGQFRIELLEQPGDAVIDVLAESGRASCRERVCQSG